MLPSAVGTPGEGLYPAALVEIETAAILGGVMGNSCAL